MLKSKKNIKFMKLIYNSIKKNKKNIKNIIPKIEIEKNILRSWRVKIEKRKRKHKILHSGIVFYECRYCKLATF